MEFVRRGLDGAVARAKYGEGRYVVEINKRCNLSMPEESGKYPLLTVLHSTGAALRNPQTIEEKAFATGIKSLYEKSKAYVN